MMNPRTGQPLALAQVHLVGGQLQAGPAPPAPRVETLAHVLLRQRARADGRGELTDEQVDAELAEALRPSAPEPARPAPAPSAYAKHGAVGAEVRRGPRSEAVAKAQEIAAGLAWERILAGMPEDDPARAWSFDRMAYWIRERWPKPHHMPALRTLVGYLQVAVKRGLLPPLAEWVEASTVPAERSKP